MQVTQTAIDHRRFEALQVVDWPRLFDLGRRTKVEMLVVKSSEHNISPLIYPPA